MEDQQSKLELLENLEAKKRLREGLPHLYGFPWYQWAWDFFQSRNPYNFLTAANQISKSSTMIRKAIHWATEPSLWPELWTVKPTQFWYFYPSRDVSTIEFDEKWVKEFLPRNEYKDHETYGWRFQKDAKKIHAIHFNSGVTIYFKSYEQAAHQLQTASVFACFCDEELPVELFPEINSRMLATHGYFHLVFTATLGQEQWRLTMEEKGKHEMYKSAFKQQISMYKCMTYMDGSPGPWTEERIERAKAGYATQAEIDRRVYGRFVVDSDRKYEGFERTRNYVAGHKLPSSWHLYSGVDIGSGGTVNHPGAIVCVAVNPTFTAGRVFLGWRGDDERTTAGDILRKWLHMKGKKVYVGQFYDHGSKDFHTIAQRVGEPFQPADKSRDFGEQLLNTLFKNEILKIYEDDELIKLVIELENLRSSTAKTNAKDDFIDALRYAVSKIPWDFSAIDDRTKDPEKDPSEGMCDREKYYKGVDKKPQTNDLIQMEFDEANLAYDYFQYE